MSCVPIFPNLSADNFLFQIAQTETKVIFVSGKENHGLCRQHSDLFNHIISLDDTAYFQKELLFDEFVLHGLANAASIDDFTLGPDDLASIIYTSGTILPLQRSRAHP